MRRVASITLLAAGLLLGSAGAAHATQYPGWGDTGWVYASKRECCNAAISIASQYSIDACVTSGGTPKAFVGGGQRGSCSSEFTQGDDGALMYRCYGEASVWCR
jgi:hypothetical protein